MTWNFDGDATNVINQVRTLVGDTDASEPQLQDWQVQMYLPGGPLACGSVYLAAAACANAIAAAYARQITTKIGTTAANLSDRIEHYRTLAKDLRRANTLAGGVTPYFGGISYGDKLNEELDDDRVVPDFAVTTDDNEGGLSGTLAPGNPWGYAN